MTNREHLISLLQARTKESYLYLSREFGCGQISSDECINHDTCYECWEHWLESEVQSNDHA